MRTERNLNKNPFSETDGIGESTKSFKKSGSNVIRVWLLIKRM